MFILGEKCMKKIQYYSSAGKLKCCGCGNWHYQWWMISHQKRDSKKTGCASIMTHNKPDNDYEIISHYGSGYDTSRFKVMRTLFSKDKLSSMTKLISQVLVGIEPLICDKCIKRFIHRKYIVRVKFSYE